MSEGCYANLHSQLNYMDAITKNLKKEGIEITNRVLDVVQNVLYDYIFGTAKHAVEAIPSAGDIQVLYGKVKSKVLGE